MASAVPGEVVAFLHTTIDSIEQLEILLFVRRTPERDWTADEIAKELRTAPASAAARLADLARHGVVTREDGPPAWFRYATTNPHAAAIDLLAVTYAERRHAVIEAIFAHPIERIRLFADAFQLRKKREDGDG